MISWRPCTIWELHGATCHNSCENWTEVAGKPIAPGLRVTADSATEIAYKSYIGRGSFGARGHAEKSRREENKRRRRQPFLTLEDEDNIYWKPVNQSVLCIYPFGLMPEGRVASNGLPSLKENSHNFGILFGRSASGHPSLRVRNEYLIIYHSAVIRMCICSSINEEVN